MNISRRQTLEAFALTTLLLSTLAPSRVGAQRSSADGLFRDASPAAGSPTRAPEHRALRSRMVVVDVDRMSSGRQVMSTRDVPATLPLNLLPDATFEAVLDRIDRTVSGFVWVGHLRGIQESSVTLAVDSGVVAGSVVTRYAAYTIRHVGGDLHVIEQVDQSAYPSELPPMTPVTAQRGVSARGAQDAIPTGTAAADDGSTIDVMVLYTPAVVAFRGSDAAVRALVNVGISETNTSYANSGITQRLRLVYAGMVGYSESGDMSVDLTNVTTSAGPLNSVGLLRNLYAADIVSLWVHYSPLPACGIGWLMTSINSSFSSNAYNVVDDDCVSPNYTFAHEMGHNMGARHDWFVDTGTTPGTYAHGYVNVSARWRTIMAYNDMCASQGLFCSRLLYWASPGRTAPAPYAPSPMGVPEGTNTSCQYYNPANPPCDADDARTLNETALTIANFRQGLPAPLAVTGLTPSAPSPRPVGGSVAWTATVNGGTGPFTYKFFVYDGTSWTVGQDWSASNSWNWAPAVAGVYSIQVWARNNGSTALYDAWLGASFTITGPPPLQVVALNSSPASGTSLGVPVLWSAVAAGGTGPYTYKFLVYDGVNWSVGRDWSTSSTWLWMPPGAGSYALEVWVRNAGSSSVYDAWLAWDQYRVAPPPPLSITSLVSSPSSGVPAGTPVQWSATATGGTGPYTYRFLLWNGVVWTVGQDWSSASTWNWIPSVAGTYSVQVWARNAGSAAVYNAWTASSPFVVTAPAPLRITGVSASPSSSVAPGASVLWTAAAIGGTGPVHVQVSDLQRHDVDTGTGLDRFEHLVMDADGVRLLHRASVGAQCWFEHGVRCLAVVCSAERREFGVEADHVAR